MFHVYLINVKRFRINSTGLIKYSDMDLALILTTLLSKSQRCKLLGGTGYGQFHSWVKPFSSADYFIKVDFHVVCWIWSKISTYY